MRLFKEPYLNHSHIQSDPKKLQSLKQKKLNRKIALENKAIGKRIIDQFYLFF